MSKSDSSASKRERNKAIRWIVIIFTVTILVSGTISFVSDIIMSGSSMFVAFLILLAIVLFGVFADVVGLAVTAADEKPFHSMAARKVPGSIEALQLLRNADRVSTICNDVIGDICGVVSGSASATIAVQILQKFEFSMETVIPLLLSALVAGLTVAGKAAGKSFAINSSTQIVSFAGSVIYFIGHLGDLFKRKK